MNHKKILAALGLFGASLIWNSYALAQEAAPDAGGATVTTAEVPAADAGAPAETGPSLMDQLDQAAGQPAKTTQPNATGAPAGSSGVTSSVMRAFQSLNPDISAIIDATGGIGTRAPYSLAGDDPDLGGTATQHRAGFTVQEAEVAFQSVVDPYFRADVFLTIPNLQGIEVEEAYATTTALPGDLQLKAGVFRSAFGRQNGQHLHLQDFTRRPLINAAYLGEDGLRPPGAQLSWLVPVPFFLQLIGEAFSVAPPDDLEHPSTFGGGKRTDLTYTVELKAFVPAAESISIYGGLNAGFGRGLANNSALEVATGSATYQLTSQLYAADLYVKYKPPNETGGFFNIAWQTEFFYRRMFDPCIPQAGGVCPLGTPGGVTPNFQLPTGDDAGFYTQLVAHVARRWVVGAREDLLGVVTSPLQQRVNRVSLSLTFTPSEFSRVRLYAEREDVTPFSGQPQTDPDYAGYLQLEIAIGAHGAHPF
jgi:hypothetical protein